MDLKREAVENTCGNCGSRKDGGILLCNRILTHGAIKCWYPIGSISVEDEETQTSEDKLV